jgi:uncharacterized DUF497 family protein
VRLVDIGLHAVWALDAHQERLRSAMPRFDWDREKGRRNAEKHGVTFEEAESAVNSPLAQWFKDLSYKGDEVRSWVLGYSDQDRLLLVVTSEGGPRPRIISAWRATKRERREYERR